MHTPKVIIHRLHTPGQRSLPRRRLGGGLLQTVAALAGFAVLIVVLSAA